jgi:hypothetical protein
MRVEYLEDPDSATPPVLLMYGDDPRGAALLRRTAEELAAANDNREVRIDRLPGFHAVDGCSLAISAGSRDSGVEPLDEARRAFRCVLRPRTCGIAS